MTKIVGTVRPRRVVGIVRRPVLVVVKGAVRPKRVVGTVRKPLQ